MAKRYFVFLYPSDMRIKALLNLAVFSLNPKEKWPAHVTVAGPFARKPAYVKSLSPHTMVFSMGLGNFFLDNLNTVHLRIGMTGIWNIWNKPDFRGNPVPHLSLYNGDSADEARVIFTRLSILKPSFAFAVTDPTIVTSESKQETTILREQIDTSLTSRSKSFNIDDIRSLDFEKRVGIAEEALQNCMPVTETSKGNVFKMLGFDIDRNHPSSRGPSAKR